MRALQTDGRTDGRTDEQTVNNEHFKQKNLALEVVLEEAEDSF